MWNLYHVWQGLQHVQHVQQVVLIYFSLIISSWYFQPPIRPLSLFLWPFLTLFRQLKLAQFKLISTNLAFIMSQALFWGQQDEEDKVPVLKTIITPEMFFPIQPADERWVVLKAQSCHTSFSGFYGLVKMELPLCLLL